MKPGIIKAGKWLLNALLPRACAHCGQDLPWLEPGPLCRGCAAALEPLPELHCKACGLPLKYGGAACYDCRGAGPRSLTLARSAFVFTPQLRSLVHAFKYRERDDLAGYLAGEMTAALPRFPELAPYAFCAAVPLHKAKARERGFNQAELLAKELAGLANLFHLEGVAVRVKNTPSQTSLTKQQRRANMEGAFSVVKPELVKGRNILLVDDVATTLSTLEALASEFIKAGARSVAAYTLAREP